MTPGAPPVASLVGPDGRRLAYRLRAGHGPTVVFLGGFRSNMDGLKAQCIERWCRAWGLPSLCLDYSGHGRSAGRFEDGCVSDWAGDALALIDALAGPRVVLVGSSMGAWIMLLVAASGVREVAGMLGLASAPDFTEQVLWPRLPARARAQLQRQGYTLVPSAHGDGPYRITRRLLLDGRRHQVLGQALRVGGPVRLLHGLADGDVPYRLSLQLAACIEAPELRVELIQGAGHRLSEPHELRQVRVALREVCAGAPG